MSSKHTIYGFILVFFVAAFSFASSGGRSDARAGAPGDSSTCSGCHSSNGGNGSITLVDAPSQITAGMTYTLTLRLEDDNASFSVGGFQIVATDGTTGDQQGSFTAPTGTRVTPLDRLVHNTPQDVNGGMVEWTFEYTAPATLPTDNIVFYMAGNAANGNGSNGDGDFGRSNNISIPFSTTPSSVFNPEQSKTQIQVFPNPLSSGQTLNADLQIEESLTNARLRLFDVTGRQVADQQLGQLSIGVDRLSFELPALPAGFYALQLEGNGQLQARVPVLIK